MLNALDFGLPQKRERTFIVGYLDSVHFQFPVRICKPVSLTEILEPDEVVDRKLWASEPIVAKRLERTKGEPFYPSIWDENKGGNVTILPYSCALRAGGSNNHLLVNGKRRPSPRELMRLQGFPDTYPIVVNYAAMRKLTGNSVAVPVIEALAGSMLHTMTQPVRVRSATQLVFP